MTYALKRIISNMWPLILVCSIILIIFRIFYIKKNNKKIIVHKEVSMLIFIIYLMCLFYVVTFQDVSVPKIGYNVIPFAEMFRYNIGSDMFYKNVIGNMLMFIPFGFFSSYILKINKLIWIILISLIVSITIEFIQVNIGRIFDIDDVILNVLGGFLGYYIFNIMYYLKNSLNIN